MADDAQQYGFRARLAHMFTTIFGQRQQTQSQQTQKSDRQVFDGFDRGADDPDNSRAGRQAGAPGPGTTTPYLTWEKYRVDDKAREAAQRQAEEHNPLGGNAVSRAAADEVRQAQELAARLERQAPRDMSLPERADGLRAALEAAQRRFEAQQRHNGRQQGRGF